MHRRPTPPPAETLAWVERTFGARVVGWRRLTGGLTSLVHELRIEENGRRESCVLRCWMPGEHDAYAVDAVASEKAVLTALAASDLPAPRLLGATTEGRPAVLMTRLPGRMLLMPRDRERWLADMARMLVRIHALDVPGKPFVSWLDRSQLAPPADATRPDLWRAAIELVADERPPAHTCFVHRDYQHFNLLWSREKLTGVVDWIEASLGPPEIDVGHCRLNLTVLFSAELAERFRELYEAEAGRALDPWWDVHALLSYSDAWPRFLPIQIDGRAPLDAAGMTGRMEDLLARALRRQ